MSSDCHAQKSFDPSGGLFVNFQLMSEGKINNLNMLERISSESFVDSSGLIEYLSLSSGLEVVASEILRVFDPEHHVSYVDCTFANAFLSYGQVFSPKMKMVGFCELLDAKEIKSYSCNGLKDSLAVCGVAIVYGVAFVYPPEGGHPQKETGVWEVNMREIPRIIYFNTNELESLRSTLRDI